MPFDPFSAIASSVGGLINFGVGLSQRRKGRKMLKEIGDSPTEVIPNEIFENQNRARIRANTGLPSEQYSQSMKNLQRQQLMQLTRANDRRGGLALLAGGQQGYNDALVNLDVQSGKQKIENEKTLYGINSNVAGWKDKVWKNNVKDVWDRKYAYANSLLGAGNQNATTGIDQAIAGGLMYGYGRTGRNRMGTRSVNTAPSMYDYSGPDNGNGNIYTG